MKKIVVITGANRGLGKSIADIALSDIDSLIICLSRSLSKEHEKVPRDKLIFIKTDLTEPFPDDVFETINRYFKKIPNLYFFNNASSILPINKIGEFIDDDIDASIMININNPVKLINYILAHSSSNNKITFVNITSGAGNNPISHWSLYSCSKAYMKMLFKILQEENKQNENLEFYEIDPGVLDTGMQESIRTTDFPGQNYFLSLKKEGKLVDPGKAALKILNEIGFIE